MKEEIYLIMDESRCMTAKVACVTVEHYSLKAWVGTLQRVCLDGGFRRGRDERFYFSFL